MKPFPNSWTGSPDTEAGYPPRQRTWQASLARWALIVLTIVGIVVLAGKAISICTAMMPGAQAVTIQNMDAITTHQAASAPAGTELEHEAAAAAANKVWWFWIGKRTERQGDPIKQGGCEAESCQSFGRGVTIKSLSWYSGNPESPTFELQTFAKPNCATSSSGDNKYREDEVDVSTGFFSWKVVLLPKK